MSIESLEKKEWVINKESGLIFMVHPLMTISPVFAAYKPTVEEIIAGCKLTPFAPVPVLDGIDLEKTPLASLGGSEVDLVRQEAIKSAVLAILPENYGAPAFGRPAMPKVADIKAATGYADVTVEEIIAVLPVAAEGE